MNMERQGRGEAEYDAAIIEIERLLDEHAEPGSEGYEHRALSRLQVEGLRRLLGIPADVLLGLDA